jgi:sulfur-oxidizing protein SoxY
MMGISLRSLAPVAKTIVGQLQTSYAIPATAHAPRSTANALPERHRGDGMLGQTRSNLTRRTLLKAACAGSAGFASIVLISPRSADATGSDEAMELVKQLIGRRPTESDRLRLKMPPVFANGYTVPLVLDVDSPMTEADHVRLVHVFAPQNPLVKVASFHFTQRSGRARVSTRIRLAEPQYVLAVAEMSDSTLLMTKAWVKVATNGCA